MIAYMSKRTTDRRKYDAIHHWIRAHYGTATKCESPNCRGISKNYQWALRKDREYDWDIECFIPLCASCHMLYDISDEARKRISKANVYRARTHCGRGHKYTPAITCMRTKKTAYGSIIWRECVVCRNINKKAFRERVKARQGGEGEV